MKSSDLFATLTGAGLSLVLSDDGGLKVSPRPTPEQAALIRQHKAAILEALHDDATEARLERWAIEEQDGAAWLWLIVRPDGVSQCSYTPPACREQVAAEYPDAVSLQPVPGAAGFMDSASIVLLTRPAK